MPAKKKAQTKPVVTINEVNALDAEIANLQRLQESMDALKAQEQRARERIEALATTIHARNNTNGELVAGITMVSKNTVIFDESDALEYARQQPFLYSELFKPTKETMPLLVQLVLDAKIEPATAFKFDGMRYETLVRNGELVDAPFDHIETRNIISIRNGSLKRGDELREQFEAVETLPE